MHKSVLINMWHNYSRGKNVVITSSILALSFDVNGYRIAMKICKDCVLESYETVKKFNNSIKNSKKFERF